MSLGTTISPGVRCAIRLSPCLPISLRVDMVLAIPPSGKGVSISISCGGVASGNIAIPEAVGGMGAIGAGAPIPNICCISAALEAILFS